MIGSKYEARLKEFIDPENLPTIVGGTNTAPLGLQHYGPWCDEIELTKYYKKWDLTDKEREDGQAYLKDLYAKRAALPKKTK